jgi:hypothetical protein
VRPSGSNSSAIPSTPVSPATRSRWFASEAAAASCQPFAQRLARHSVQRCWTHKIRNVFTRRARPGNGQDRTTRYHECQATATGPLRRLSLRQWVVNRSEFVCAGYSQDTVTATGVAMKPFLFDRAANPEKVFLCVRRSIYTNLSRGL